MDDPKSFAIVGENTTSASRSEWDLDADEGGWSPSISPYRPHDGDRSVIHSDTFIRKEARASVDTQEIDDEDALRDSFDTQTVPWKVSLPVQSTDHTDESPLTSLAGAVPRMVDEALEKAQSFLRENVVVDRTDNLRESDSHNIPSVEHLQTSRPNEAASTSHSVGTLENPPMVLRGSSVEQDVPKQSRSIESKEQHGISETGIDPKSIVEMVRDALAGMLDERLKGKEEEQRLLVSSAVEESRNLAQRAAELESALEQSMRRERELAQKLTTKETDDRRSDAQQVPASASIGESELQRGRAATSEDSNASKENSEHVQGSVNGASQMAQREDRGRSSTLSPSRPPMASSMGASVPVCSAHGLPLTQWSEAMQAAMCSRCISEQKCRYDCSFGTSPKASTRIQSIAGACETRVKILDETLRELEGGKIAMLEEELVSTDRKLEELTRLVETAARDLREDFEQAMELLQATRRVKEHMLMDHRQQLEDVAEKIATLRRARDEGSKVCETVDHTGMVSFLSNNASSKSQECWQLIARPLPRSVQVPLDDIPFEVAKRKELLREAQCSGKLLRMKNEVLCDIVEALKEERATHVETREYAVEVESLLDAYAAEWEKKFDYVCSYCGQSLEAALANEPCCEATGRQKAHFWVPTDSVGFPEVAESERPRIPLVTASPKRRSLPRIRAVSPMFRADSSVDVSPSSLHSRFRDKSPCIGVERTDSEILSIVGTLLRDRFPQDITWPFRRQSEKAQKGILSRLELWKTIREDLDSYGILNDSEVDRVMLCCDTEKNGVLEIDKFMKLFKARDIQPDMR